MSKRKIEENNECNKTVKGVFARDDLDDSLSSADWGYLNEDQIPQKRRSRFVKFEEELLHLSCCWDSCEKSFGNYHNFIHHLKDHVHDNSNDLNCYWSECSFTAASYQILMQHVTFHGYHAKLINIGRNVEDRQPLPECKDETEFQIPNMPGYNCEWEDCNKSFDSIYDFLEHVKMHVYNNPESSKIGIIKCHWKGCNNKTLNNRYRLGEHVRTHTKEKVIACPKCRKLYCFRTKFVDHRLRQMPKDSQSYLCSQCSKYFPSEKLLKDHMRLHIMQYKCPYCEMTCPKPDVLAQHIRFKHMKLKPMKCTLCNYRAVNKCNLMQHIKTHDDNFAYQCEECDFQCRSERGLVSHRLKIHNRGMVREYECHNCQKRYNRGSLLTKHLKIVHKYHWPSGHSRFRYKLDEDGYYRLQTVRYETLEVTEEIMKQRTTKSNKEKKKFAYGLVKKEQNQQSRVDQFEVVIKKELEEGDEEEEEDDGDNDIEEEEEDDDDNDIEEEEEEEEQEEEEEEEIDEPPKKKLLQQSKRRVLITIEDLDSKGNILKSETIQS